MKLKYTKQVLSSAGTLLALMPIGVRASKPDYKSLQLPEKPNILWLVAEDLCSYLEAFGDKTVATPNLSRLAGEGVIYSNMYSVSGVSAPSRAAIITGMYPTAIGANNMRTDSYTHVTGLKAYEAVPAPEVKMFSETLRTMGYYCSNNFKEDYQFKPPVTGWDESSAYAHWRNRANGQPFFAVFNFTNTHESGLFEPYGFRHAETRHYHSGDRSYKWKEGNMTEAETPVHLPKDTKFPIPPYIPDTEISRRDFWKEYNNIAEIDKQIGAIIKQLEDDGLLENTIIFFYGDNGGPYPRGKRLVYDSGLRVPLIIRFPEKQLAGSNDEQLLSFVDFAPTLLSLAGQKPAAYIQGQAFLGKYSAKKQRKYIYGAADRFDEITDVIRAVRDSRFKYIRNYRPEQGYYLPISYREQIPMMKEMLQLNKEGKLDAYQAQWFRNSKPKEELFDCVNDPFELHNLADNLNYKKKLKELSNALDSWIAVTGDVPDFPEAELIKKLWNNAENKPQTAKPVITTMNGRTSISCATKGASIGYKIITKNAKEPAAWSVYQQPLQLPENATLMAKAHRIGYVASETVKDFKIIAESNPAITTHYLKSGNFMIGITDNGGGILNNITLPGKGDIMDVQTDMYGRAGQVAIRDASHGGRYNPTQAGFFETLGTQCEVIESANKLTVVRRPLSLWHGDGKYDFTEWENIGADPYKNDNGNTDIDGLDESQLPGKQETEVTSEFDYYGTYENIKGKFGINSPAIRHYIEISFIREPGHCLHQFRPGTKLFNEKALSKDISKEFPEGVHKGTANDMNGMIAVWSLRHDRAKWVHAYVHYRTADGQWKTQAAIDDLNEESDNTVIILSDSLSLNSGTALGLYRPESDINEYFIIGRNEKTNKTVYKDKRYSASNEGTRLTYSYKRTPTMAKYGFSTRCTGMINRTALEKDIYEVYRGEYYILQGTPNEIMDAVQQIDKAGKNNL